MKHVKLMNFVLCCKLSGDGKHELILCVRLTEQLLFEKMQFCT